MGRNIIKMLKEAVDWTAVLLFAALLTLLFLQVVLRYCFNTGFSWIEDFLGFCFVWISLLGVALGVYKKSHIAMDAIVALFPEKWKRLCMAIQKILCILFYVILLYSGILYTVLGRRLKSPVLKWEYSLMYAAIPVMCGVSLLFLMPHLLAGKKERAEEK